MPTAQRRAATSAELGSRALLVCALLAYLAGISTPCPAREPGRAHEAKAAAAHASALDAWCGSRPLVLLTAPCPCGCGEVPASLASPLGFTLLLASQPLALPLASTSAPAGEALRLPDPVRRAIDHVPLGA